MKSKREQMTNEIDIQFSFSVKVPLVPFMKV